MKGLFFTVVDRVVAREAGSFDMKTHWHPLGRSFVDGNRVSTEQIGDARFELLNVSGHMQRWKQLPNQLCQPFYRKTAVMYPYVEPNTEVLSLEQRQICALQPGEHAAFINLLHSYRTFEKTATLDARPVSPTQTVVMCADGALFLGLGPVDVSGLRTDAGAFVFGETVLSGVGVTSIAVGGREVFRASAPVGIEIQTIGKAIVVADAPCDVLLPCGSDRRLVVDGIDTPGRRAEHDPGLLAVHLETGLHVIAFSAAAMAQTGVVDTLARAVRELHQSTPTPRLAASEPALSDDARKGLELLWQHDPEAGVTQLLCADIDQDGRTETLLAQRNGALQALDSRGGPRFRFETGTGQSVNCLDVGHTRARDAWEIAIGSDDHHIYLVDARGELLWELEPYADPEGMFVQSGRGQWGKRVIVIKMLDIDDDGRDEVYAATNLVGSTTGQHIGIDPSGRQIFAGWGISRYRPVLWYGKMSIDGTAYLATGPRGFLLRAVDKPKDQETTFEWREQFPNLGREADARSKRLKLAKPFGRVPWPGGLQWLTADLDGDGTDELLSAGDRVLVYWHDGKATNDWPHSGAVGRKVGAAARDWRGGARGLCVVDADNDGTRDIVVAGEHGFVQIHRFSKTEAALEQIVEQDFFAEVHCVDAAIVNGKPRIAVGADNGLFVMDGEGTILAYATTPSPVVQVEVTDLGGAAVVTRQRDVGYFREDGREATRIGAVTAYRLR